MDEGNLKLFYLQRKCYIKKKKKNDAIKLCHPCRFMTLFNNPLSPFRQLNYLPNLTDANLSN